MANRIRDAIEVLARRGWTQGTFTDEGGRHCLQGALTGTGTDLSLAADIRLVNETIAAEYPERVGAVGVSRFNDHPETTIDDVVRVLEKSAIRRDETA